MAPRWRSRILTSCRCCAETTRGPEPHRSVPDIRERRLHLVLSCRSRTQGCGPSARILAVVAARSGEDRPRPHRNNDCIGFDHGAIDLDTCCATLALGDPANPTVPQLRALRLSGAHHCGGELTGVDLRCGLGP